MSDPINANPSVLDISSLPTRLEDSSFKKNDNKRSQIKEKISSLSLFTAYNDPSEMVPDLETDNETDNISTEDELIEVSGDEEDLIDPQEIFDLISSISDPEHPLTLAQLAVVNLPDIKITHGENKLKDISEVLIKITPTITHCSLATLIGLGIRVRLERCLPPRFRIKILIKEGTHQSENQVNKQLNDKERVAAACENDQLLSVISQMLSTCK